MIQIILIALAAFGVLGLRVCNQYVRCVHFRLGKFQSVRGPGLFWIFPFIEWVDRVDMRTITASVDAQDAITKDNAKPALRANAAP